MWQRASKAHLTKLAMPIILTALSLPLATTCALGGEKLWVQAIQTELKDEPKLTGKKVADLKRGDPLEVIKKDGIWFQAKAAGGSGWISKLFVTDHPPVGNADLQKDVKVTMEKTSRRRSSSYAVSASARGLNPEGRSREGRARYQADFNTVREIEAYRIDNQAINKFRKEANMGGR